MVSIIISYKLHICECLHAKLLQSRLTLCDSMDWSPPGSSVYGILQGKILKWVAMPSSRGSSWPRNWTVSHKSPALADRFFTTSTTWEAHKLHIIALYFSSSPSSILLCTFPPTKEFVLRFFIYLKANVIIKSCHEYPYMFSPTTTHTHTHTHTHKFSLAVNWRCDCSHEIKRCLLLEKKSFDQHR